MKYIPNIKLLNANGMHINTVYQRYATSQVNQGKAYWVNNNTIKQICNPTTYPINQVFYKKGLRIKVSDVMLQLANCFTGTYPKRQASGSLGGASKNQFISLIVINNVKYWERIK